MGVCMVVENHSVYIYSSIYSTLYQYIFGHLLRARVYDFRRVLILIYYTNCINALIFTK